MLSIFAWKILFSLSNYILWTSISIYFEHSIFGFFFLTQYNIQLWHRASDRRPRIHFQMPPQSYWMLAVYVFVKFMIKKIPWSVVSRLPWLLSLEKISHLCQRQIKIVEGEIDGAAIYIKLQKFDSYHCKMSFASQE